jgi:hypothetical protein
MRATRKIAIAAASQLVTASPLAASTILQEVLNTLGEMYDAPLISMFGNAAFNAPERITVATTLKPADRVIIGYDAVQNPVFGVASDTGLLVTPEQAAALQTGLAAGLYPQGSTLYRLPPAGQLSLFNQAADGVELARAEEFLMTRIDGRVSNIVVGMLLPDLAPAAMVAAYDPVTIAGKARLPSTIDSTVLGAVNTGTVITNVEVIVGGLPGGANDLGLSSVSVGANGLAGLARTKSAMALSAGVRQMGYDADIASVSYNIAMNAMDVDGRVRNEIRATNFRVGEITSTVIGAVNGGGINHGVNPADN